MDEPRRFNVARLWQQYGLRLLRYGGVTVVSTIVGLSTLVFGIRVLAWSALSSNFLSVIVSTPPSYYLNRHWVWGKNPGDHSVSREVGPFWIMTILGFVISSIIVWSVSQFTDRLPLILLAQMASFGLLWLLKFAFLEKVIWKDRAHAPVTESV